MYHLIKELRLTGSVVLLDLIHASKTRDGFSVMEKI